VWYLFEISDMRESKSEGAGCLNRQNGITPDTMTAISYTSNGIQTSEHLDICSCTCELKGNKFWDMV